MDYKNLYQLSEEKLLDLALEKDLDIFEHDTQQDIINKILKRTTSLAEISDPLQEMVKYLRPAELLKLCETNQVFRNLCESDETWRIFIERDFGIDMTNSRGSRRYYEDLMVRDMLYKWKQVIGPGKKEGYWRMFEIAKFGLSFKEDFLGSHPLTKEEKLYISRIAQLVAYLEWQYSAPVIQVRGDLYDNLVKNVAVIFDENEIFPLQKHLGIYYVLFEEMNPEGPNELSFGDRVIMTAMLKGKEIYRKLVNNENYQRGYIRAMKKKPPTDYFLENFTFERMQSVKGTEEYVKFLDKVGHFSDDLIIRNLH